MKITVENLISTIQNLDPKFKYFHLTECVCGALMWQQPCLICCYYPPYTKHVIEYYCTKESFCKYINHSGNILEFYFKSFMRTLDPQKHILDNARKTTQGWEWPSAEEIWDYFKNKEKTK
jgi:hypothetical protein